MRHTNICTATVRIALGGNKQCAVSLSESLVSYNVYAMTKLVVSHILALLDRRFRVDGFLCGNAWAKCKLGIFTRLTKQHPSFSNCESRRLTDVESLQTVSPSLIAANLCDRVFSSLAESYCPVWTSLSPCVSLGFDFHTSSAISHY